MLILVVYQSSFRIPLVSRPVGIDLAVARGQTRLNNVCRYLAVFILLAMILGVLLGNYDVCERRVPPLSATEIGLQAQGVHDAFHGAEWQGVSIRNSNPPVLFAGNTS